MIRVTQLAILIPHIFRPSLLDTIQVRSMAKYLAAFLLLFVPALIISTRPASTQVTEGSSDSIAAVSITYPANNAVINVPTNIFVSANVSSGNVQRVDFYANDDLIGSDTSAPYFIVWNNPSVSTFTLTAEAVEATGATTTSPGVNITTVFPGQLYPLPIPGPTLLNPAHGAVLSQLTPVTLSATRSLTQYTVARVEFYDNTNLIGVDTTEPYSIVWTAPPIGLRSITARTVVTTGARASSAVADVRIVPGNASVIGFNDLAPASLYPSSIEISDFPGVVSGLSLTLQNLSHTGPDDIDLLLVAPNGRSIVLMSDVGGTTPVNNLTLTFNSEASTPLPDDGAIVSGTYRPTNVGAGDVFPAPAPAGGVVYQNLSDFNGTPPNGTWSLYAFDDESGNVGSISGGWGLTVFTSSTICNFNLSHSVQAFPHTGGNGSVTVNSSFPSCDWTAISNSEFITFTSGTSGTGPTNVTFAVAPNTEGARTLRTVIAGRPFNIQQASGCPFALAQETMQVSGGGGIVGVNVTAANLCTWFSTTTDNWITINSGTGQGDGSVNLTVQPNRTGATRTGRVLVGARTLNIVQSPASGRTRFDFDGDGKTDIALFRPQEGIWYLLLSSNNTFRAHRFGISTDRLVPADYDGDGKADVAVWRAETATWHILRSSDNNYVARQFGISTDIPLSGDFDGDGKSDVAVFRPADGAWHILQSLNGTLRSQQFGAPGDKPLTGDFDADGKADLAVFRPSNGSWYVLRSTDNSFFAQQFGIGSDRPVTGDYDGDNRTDVAVFRTADSAWYIWQSSNNSLVSHQFGASGDIPAAGDYDGDGKTDIAVFRPSNGTWYLINSSNGAFSAQQFGSETDVPVASAFVP